MAEADPFGQKLSILLKEWDHVQFHIGRLDTIIFSIRQWSILVFTAFLTASYTLKKPEMELVAIVPIILFWLLDALHKSFQRRFIARGHEIEDFLSSPKFDKAQEERSLHAFAAPKLSAGFGKGSLLERIRDVLSAVKLRNVAMTYVSMLCVCVVSYFVLRLGLWTTSERPSCY